MDTSWPDGRETIGTPERHETSEGIERLSLERRLQKRVDARAHRRPVVGSRASVRFGLRVLALVCEFTRDSLCGSDSSLSTLGENPLRPNVHGCRCA